MFYNVRSCAVATCYQSTNTINMNSYLHLSITLTFICQGLCLPCYWEYSLMAYQCKLAFHWHFLFGSGCNHSFFKAQSQVSEKQLASPQRVLLISEKSQVPLQIENLFWSNTHAHTDTHTLQLKLALKQFRVKLCDLASSCDFNFTASHLIVILVPPPFKHTNLTIPCSDCWKYSYLGLLKDFQVEFTISSFCFCCLHLCMFASATMSFAAALQLFVFLV